MVAVPGGCPLEIPLDERTRVSGLWQSPDAPLACLVLAHGAGAGMAHPFLDSIASLLQVRGVATLRYQFPYRDRGSRRPDAAPVCHATVRAAVVEAQRRCAAPLFAGGKSFGGRMTSQAQAAHALPAVRGLAFLGFPLHPARRPATQRAEHLARITIPMLFLQGTRDELAELPLLRAVTDRLGPLATLQLSEGADHAFHVPARSGRTDAAVREQLAGSLIDWMKSVLRR